MKRIYIYVNWKKRRVAGTFSPFKARKSMQLVKDGYVYVETIDGWDLSGAFNIHPDSHSDMMKILKNIYK